MIELPPTRPARFRIVRPLAEGGFSAIHVAHDEELNREVALKEMRGRFATNAWARSRLLFEAEVTAGLEHPGVVPVHGLGLHDDGRAFFTMRYVRGRDLKKATESVHRTGDPEERDAQVRRLLDRLVDACYTVHFAHGRGILHRDLTPSNIMIGAHGETLVVDWGLAKRLDGLAEPDHGIEPDWPATARGLTGTRMGESVGTPSYMSPESALGRLDRLGPATDVYSLGATLYKVLTGRSPFRGTDAEIADRTGRNEFPPPRKHRPGIDPDLEAVCLRAMEREPEDRFQTPIDLGDAIADWLAENPADASLEALANKS